MNMEVASSDKEPQVMPGSFYSGEWKREKPQSRPNIEVAIWTVGFVFHRRILG